MRGALTPQIQETAKKHLGREISLRELRLMPYAQYVMMNNQKIDPSKINTEERKIWADWKNSGWVDGGMTGCGICKDFWDALNEILWLGYVAHED
ncbi:MAG: hypothetical protein FMNOHCHN_03935 [Ignavibacteriaceae bacterium]|nr:hypothetical protein [Ignavibacteriaceae bacterium]